MQLPVSRSAVAIAGLLAAALCLYSQNVPGKEDEGKPRPGEPQGLPPRATPGDYQAHVAAGAVTIAAEFTSHFVPLPQGTLTTDDFVVVEVGMFAADGTKLNLAVGDFSLRINGRKPGVPAEPYGAVASSLHDPEAEPPASASKSKSGGLSTGGGGQNDPPPLPPKVPIEKRRAMAQGIQKASLAEGVRDLPQAGLLFFPYRGKDKGILSVELVYSGAAGQAALPLQP